MSVLPLFFVFISCIIIATSCPLKCNCTSDTVDCKRKGLDRFDEKIQGNVKKLRLQGNQFDSSVFESFNEQLEYIDLSNNAISNLSQESFNRINQLKTLKLRKNKLTQIPLGIESLNKLKLLDLRTNQIWNLTKNEVILLANVEQVDLGKNLIQNWPELLSQIPINKNNLKILNLSNNKLNQLHSNQFASLYNLQTLKLAKNRLKHLELNVFDGLDGLLNLDLSRNLLKTIQPLSFNSLNALEDLNLARNFLTSIQPGAFYGTEQLQKLNLSSNRLQSNLISNGGFYGLVELKILDLSNNQFTKFPNQISSYSPGLKKLWLNGNKIKQISGSRITLTNLEFLSLSSNQLESIQSGILNGLESLIELELSNNNLASFIEDKSILSNFSLPSIKRLNFASNNLRVLRSNAFAQFSSLEHLDLRNNPINIIEKGSFNGVKLKELFIETTSLHCDCTLKWFIEWLSDNVIDLENIRMKCQSPVQLKGQNLLDISENQLICSTDSPLARFDKHPQLLHKMQVGSNARFTCSGYGAGPLTLKWKVIKEGCAVELDNGTNKFLTFVNHTKNNKNDYVYGELEIQSLEMEDAADYQCSIENLHGVAYLDPIKLVVQRPPEFRLKPKNVIAFEGANVLLECAANGDPSPLITWDKDKRKEFPAAIERRLYLKETEDGVILLNVSKRDEGLYTCHASNEAKHIAHSVLVEIIEKAQTTKSIPSSQSTASSTTKWMQITNKSQVKKIKRIDFFDKFHILIFFLSILIGIATICFLCLLRYFCCSSSKKDEELESNESERPLHKAGSTL